MSQLPHPQCGANKDTDPLEVIELIVMKCVQCVENNPVSDVNTSKTGKTMERASVAQSVNRRKMDHI